MPSKVKQAEAARPESRARERLVVRRARTSDREAIAAVASRIWGGTDYLPLVWDHWLKDREGALLTATLEGRPVGVSKVTVLAPGEVWLEGLRLDPSLHGRGLSRQINRATFRTAKALGAKSIRYATGLSNAASRHLAEVRGFWLVARSRYVVARSAPLRTLSSRKASPADLKAVARFVRASECYRAMSGLYGLTWRFPALDERRLRRLVAAGRVLVLPRRGAIRAVGIWDRDDREGEVCLGYVDGSDRDIARIARDARAVAASLGEQEVSAMLPVGRIADIVHRCGYDADPPANAVVYELGARGFRKDDAPIEDVLWRALRRNAQEAADRIAGLLTERAERPVAFENARDFVWRNLIIDPRRDVYEVSEPLANLFSVHWMRNTLRAILTHLVERCGIDRSAFSVRGRTATIRYRGRPFARCSVRGRVFRLSLVPTGATLELTETRHIARAIRAIDAAAAIADARRPGGRRAS